MTGEGSSEGKASRKRRGLAAAWSWLRRRAGGSGSGKTVAAAAAGAAALGRRAREAVRHGMDSEAGRVVEHGLERAASAAAEAERGARRRFGWLAEAFSRRETVAGVETAFDESGNASVVVVRDRAWMTGVRWQPELERRRAVRRRAREYVRHMRAVARQGAAGMDGTDDVVVTYSVGEGRAAWGVGSSSEGHEGGMPSAAAQVHAFFFGLEQAEAEGDRGWSTRSGILCGFDVPGGGHYVVAWKGDMPIVGTDRVYRERREAIANFMEKRELLRAQDNGWLMVAPGSWNVVGGVDTSVALEQVLDGRAVAVAKTWKGEVAQYVRLAVMGAGVAAVGWAFLQVTENFGVDTEEARLRLVQMRQSLREQIRELVPVEEYGEIYAVEEAPWETGPGPVAEHLVGVCTSLVRNERVALSAAELGRAVSRVLCSAEGDRLWLEVETVGVVASADPRVLRRRSGAFQGLEQREIVPVVVPRGTAGAAWYGDFADVVRLAPGAELVLETIEVEHQENSEEAAWARAWFGVLADSGLDRLPTLRNVLSRPEVVVAELSFLVNEGIWEVKGWIAAETPVLREVREQEALSVEAKAENERRAEERRRLEAELDALGR